MKQLTPHDASYQNIMDYKTGTKLPDKITVLYVRLSNEDKDKTKGDDSDSIINQKKMLSKYVINKQNKQLKKNRNK